MKRQSDRSDKAHPRDATAEAALRPRRRARASLALVVLAAIIGGIVAVRVLGTHAPANPARSRSAQRIPVVSARAHRGNIDVYLTGLGVVTPLYTVTVKTRIDGQLMTVSYKEGEMVRKGQLLAEIDPRPYQVQLAQAEAQLSKDQAVLQNAQTDLQRYETLITRNAVAQQVLATQRTTVAQADGAVKADRASVESARLNISYCHITDPLTGRVGLRLIDPGNMVSAAAGTPLAVITQMQPISVIFTIPEPQVPAVFAQVKAGRHLRVDALDHEMHTVLATGQLTTLDNQIDQTTGTLKLRAIVPNTDQRLFPNQFVNARLLVQEKTGVTVVPNAAVQRNAATTFVYLVKPDQTVTIRNVVVGATDADQSEIVSGLEPGATVVTQGVDKLQEGTPVSAELRNSATPEPGR
jgi:multidrug efflux system membrane fusion protein